MKIKTIVIAPYPGLFELALGLKDELTDFDLSVEHGDLSRVLPLIDRIHAEGYDMMISRGGTAKLLRQHSSLPVVEIPISALDMLRILTLAKGYNAKCEMIGFSNIIEGFMSVSSLMEIDISYKVIEHEREVGAALGDAKSRGVQMVIGDSITVRMAVEYGLQGVLITSGVESLKEAFFRAGQIYKSAQKLNVKNKMYQAMLSQLSGSYAATDQSGNLIYANPSFRQLLKLPEMADTLNTMYPGLISMLRDVARGAEYDRTAVVYEPEQGLYIRVKSLLSDGESPLYMLIASPGEPKHSGLVASYLQANASYFAYQDDAGQTMRATVYPAAIYGPQGSGRKRLAISYAVSTSSEGLFYLQIRSSAEELPRAIMELMLYGGGRVTALEGIELLTALQQRELLEFIDKRKMKVVFLFERNPEDLLAEEQISAKLLRSFQAQTVSLPALRESPWLERSIRSCLIRVNERQGKQIVGIRDEVMNVLLAHSWDNNFTELLSVMELFVTASDGPFIEADVLHLFEEGSYKAREQRAEPALGGLLNLRQPLAQIERDIIQIVLEQEGMNQSMAAKRLDINRSTLWRKLKEQ